MTAYALLLGVGELGDVHVGADFVGRLQTRRSSVDEVGTPLARVRRGGGRPRRKYAPPTSKTLIAA